MMEEAARVGWWLFNSFSYTHTHTHTSMQYVISTNIYYTQHTVFDEKDTGLIFSLLFYLPFQIYRQCSTASVL